MGSWPALIVRAVLSMQYPASERSSIRFVEVAVLIALACVLGAVERTLAPVTLVPGIRLGLGNLAVLVALVRHGPGAAGAVAAGKVLIVGFAFGTALGPVGLMSAAGGALAWLAMSGLARLDGRFTVVGLSIAGASAHVVGQLGVAAVVSGSAASLSLTPLLLIASLPTGIAVGLASRLLLSRISRPVLSAAEG